MGLGKGKIERYARIYVDGYDLSGDARQFGALENGFEEVDFTGWGNSVKQYAGGYRVVGVRDFVALVNNSTGQSFDALKDAASTGGVSVLFGSNAEPVAGNTAYLIGHMQISAGSSFESGAGVLTASFVANGAGGSLGTNPLGYTLLPKTTLSGADDGTAVDTGATAGSGWSSNLHVLTAGGSGTFTVESATSAGGTYSTLGTFSLDGSVVNSEHISGSALVNRYVRYSVSGSPSCVAVVTFARNNYA